MLRFGKKNLAKENFYGGKKLINVWDVNVDNRIASKLIKTSLILSTRLDI